MVCKVGGAAVGRHNYVRDALGFALRPLVSSVRWEKLVAEIQRENLEDARLDLIICDPVHGALLDIVVFHPLKANGTGVYSASVHESAKYSKYRQSQDGRRVLSKPLIPVVVSTFGRINDTAVSYLDAVEGSAQLKDILFYASPQGPQSLCELLSLVTILEVADIVLSTHTQSLASAAHGQAGGAAPHGA